MKKKRRSEPSPRAFHCFNWRCRYRIPVGDGGRCSLVRPFLDEEHTCLEYQMSVSLYMAESRQIGEPCGRWDCTYRVEGLCTIDDLSPTNPCHRPERMERRRPTALTTDKIFCACKKCLNNRKGICKLDTIAITEYAFCCRFEKKP